MRVQNIMLTNTVIFVGVALSTKNILFKGFFWKCALKDNTNKNTLMYVLCGNLNTNS